MNLQQRVDLLVRLGEYILLNNASWQAAKSKAYQQNNWFTPEYIDLAANNIATQFLQPAALQQWIGKYKIPAQNITPKKTGLVMAGNIPLVGFHDCLCTFITGHHQVIKPSSKDDVLIKHLVQQLWLWDETTRQIISFNERLNGSDAFIATGSNNSARYFDYYFKKYPHIIRRNRTSVAILTGNETMQELEQLAGDVCLYFGLGCRNVTKLYVPEQYDFIPLLEALKKYQHHIEHHKYKNNYDYNLAILILNKAFYMTNGAIILSKNPSPFAAISQLNYEFYTPAQQLTTDLLSNDSVQCIVGRDHIPFGQAQSPTLTDYADGVDTLQFLLEL